MKIIQIVIFTVFASTACVMKASESLSPTFQQYVTGGIVCDPIGGEQDIKRAAIKARFDIVYFREAEGDGFVGYEGLFKRKSGVVKILGYDLMAVYFEPSSSHFLVLLNASKEEVVNAVNSLGLKLDPIVIEYHPSGEAPSTVPHHSGKHMEQGGDNSNRILFSILGRFDMPLIPSAAPYSIEVESCDDTKSKWFSNICSQFTQKPLTWVGCAMTVNERMNHWMTTDFKVRQDNAKQKKKTGKTKNENRQQKSRFN
jgi:hypothetical protein